VAAKIFTTESSIKSCSLIDLEHRIAVLEVKRTRNRSNFTVKGKRRFRSLLRNKINKDVEQTCYYHKKFCNKTFKYTIRCNMSKSCTDKQET